MMTRLPTSVALLLVVACRPTPPPAAPPQRARADASPAPTAPQQDSADAAPVETSVRADPALLSGEDIAAAIRARRSELQACWQQLADSQTGTNRPTISFTIDPDGHVIDTRGLDDPAGKCVAAILVTIRFRATGSKVVISYPWH